MVLSISIQLQTFFCSSNQMLHFIIFKFTLKENWPQLSSPVCLMNLPHFCFSVIYLFICKWLKVGKVQIICKACDRPHFHIVIYRVYHNNTLHWKWNNYQNFLVSISQCSNLDSPPNRNCGVKNPPYNKLLHFLLTLQFAASLISQPWSFTRPWCIIYLSVFPAWLFLGLGSEGEIKQTPFWSWQGLQSLNPRAVPPSPGLTEAASDKGAVCYELLRKKKKKHNREGYLVFLWPLKPSEMKRLSIFTRRGRPLQHRTPVWASKLSRNFNQRQITVYCVVYCAPSPQSEGAKGQK